MKHHYYPYRASENYLSFAFESQSLTKRIAKEVEFLLIEEDLYNLAFGDLDENGMIDDLSVSNNKDMRLVLATVIQTIIVFFEIYPDKRVLFRGSTPARTRLYQIIINKEKANWQSHFIIEGLIGDDTETFQAEKNYSAFVIRKKL
ncbi:DUF6934 family protein [Dyadobacter fanqingshengii]|uniref:Uncharacterized protein n=1 Tax=Dyadobacter fanqingshengii TaxID=2906443 RepID=A0A9X1PB85_9BACT|nr:hypothetical protein [Dyadobacter fanqingshengii]MCF0042061.1 hypothetical protein [Dyadobacter fanqingshengii]USJ35401.1 hypothetical protein NFI81_22260 [Dyadobacter fanqingshengii]